MRSTYYSAAWTECGCLITCWHRHRTVSGAAAGIRTAGGYVVAVSSGVMRSLTVAEEADFRGTRRSHPGHNPALETLPAQKEEGSRRSEGETLVEFVLRVLSTYGYNQH